MSDSAPPLAAPTTSDSRTLTKRKVGEVVSSLDALVRDPLSSAVAKKRKTSSPHPRTSTPKLEAILARSGKHKAVARTAAPPLNYDPTSLPALLARLATYRLASFSPSKPPSLSSLNCALHGWTHTPTTRERVQCTTCAQGVVLLPPSSGETWSSPAGVRLRQEYERLLLAPTGAGHAENCPWRLRPCARGLYRLAGGGLGVQSGGRRRFLEVVGQQARELDERGLGETRLELPQEVQRLVGTEEGRARLVKAVQAVAAANPANSESANEPPPPTATAVLLAVFGWTLPAATPTLSRSDSTSSLSSLRSNASTTSSPVLSCTLCLRQVLASPYLPTPSSGGDVAPSTPAKAFDPVKQHQPFCPFVDASAGHSPPVSATASAGQVAGKGAGLLKPGWQVRLEAILQRSAGLAADARGAQAGAQESEGPEQGRAAELAATGKAKELLSYVRSLLGPKGSLRSGAKAGGGRAS